MNKELRLNKKRSKHRHAIRTCIHKDCFKIIMFKVQNMCQSLHFLSYAYIFTVSIFATISHKK